MKLDTLTGMARSEAKATTVRYAIMTDRPNIVLILVDDMGYSDLGCYGSEINTPNLDSLAENGLRFSQFYNGARCCPTRASLLTGLYAHQAGVGKMVGPTNIPGPYQGYLNDQCVTIAEVLGSQGYSTYMSGKWHVGEERPHWPVDRGFDRHYGLISGAMNYFDFTKGKNPDVVRNFAKEDQPHVPSPDGFYSTDAFTDYAAERIDEHDSSKPFFLYLAYNAPHWPLHALPEDIERYRGKYMSGWPELRKQRYQKLVEIGLIDESWALSEQDENATDWNSLTDEQKAEMDHKMAIYAAQVDRMDQGVGKIMDALTRNGYDDNTLVMFLSDNGACHEGGSLGGNFRPDFTGEMGTVDSYHSYGLSWSNAGNTPFKKHKSWIHEGGISTPLIVHWPKGISEPGTITHQVGHIVDVMTTCCEVADVDYPSDYQGRPVTPQEGLSLTPIFAGKERDPHDLIFWEHFGNRGVRCGKWKMVEWSGKHGKGWELYDMENDRTELNNLIEDKPDVATELLEKYDKWAKRVGV